MEEAWKEQNKYDKRAEQLYMARQELQALIPPRDSFIWVDDDTWGAEIFEDWHAIPFLERDGRYWDAHLMTLPRSGNLSVYGGPGQASSSLAGQPFGGSTTIPDCIATCARRRVVLFITTAWSYSICGREAGKVKVASHWPKRPWVLLDDGG